MKFIRNMIILGIIFFIIFLAIAISGGGDKFRWVGKQIGGVAAVAGNKLALEADEWRKTALEYEKRIKETTAPSPEREKAKSK